MFLFSSEYYCHITHTDHNTFLSIHTIHPSTSLALHSRFLPRQWFLSCVAVSSSVTLVLVLTNDQNDSPTFFIISSLKNGKISKISWLQEYFNDQNLFHVFMSAFGQFGFHAIFMLILLHVLYESRDFLFIFYSFDKTPSCH